MEFCLRNFCHLRSLELRGAEVYGNPFPVRQRGVIAQLVERLVRNKI